MILFRSKKEKNLMYLKSIKKRILLGEWVICSNKITSCNSKYTHCSHAKVHIKTIFCLIHKLFPRYKCLEDIEP